MSTPLVRRVAAEIVAIDCEHRARTLPVRASVPDFDAIFREFAPYFVRVLPRMGVAEADLDDVMQDVFFAVHRALPGFEARSSLKTWVYGICIRVCSNYRRRAHRLRERLPGELPEVAVPQIQERALVAQQGLVRLDAALAVLSEAQREAFVLHEIEQLSIPEIAAALCCSKFTIYARLYAARRAVRAAMRRSLGEEGHG